MQMFKFKAKQHLFNYVSAKKVKFQSYCILQDCDALAHQFVRHDPEFINEVERRCKIYDKADNVKAQFKNMLRSEHIPYNFFIPLKLHKDKASVVQFFRILLHREDISEINKFEIEWAPNDSKKALDDKTSFDTYIQFELNNGRSLGVGIEVKYTEKSYPFTKTEFDRLQLQNHKSPYYRLWADPISIYKPETYPTLGKKSYKQFFRNHLLGISMVKNGELEEFLSIHLYPSGNTYQHAAAEAYLQTIQTDMQHTFFSLTYETFIQVAKEILQTDEDKSWSKYLYERYIVR